MKNILTKTLYVLLTLLLIAVASLFLIPLLPIENNVQVKIVKSGSMEPYIETGGVVVIKPNASYVVGDVITFGKDSAGIHPTTHRVLSISESGGEVTYQTKGDANEEMDPQVVNGREVIGKVIFTLPYAGFLLDFARQPLGFALLIAIPAALVIFYEIIDITKEIRKVLRRRKKGTVDSDKSKTFKRISPMDDVWRPAYAIVTERSKASPAAVLVLVAAAGLSFNYSPSTVSYFADAENSLANTASAMSFRIEASVDGLEYYVGESGGSTIDSTVNLTPAGAPHEYKIRVEKKDGSDAFCQALMMSSTSTPPFNYDGPLLGFTPPPTSFTGNWQFVVSLAENAVGINPEDICTVELVYSAGTWFADQVLYGGYSDEARTLLTFEASDHDYSKQEVQAVQANETLETSTSTEPVIEPSNIEEIVTEKPEPEIVPEEAAVTELPAEEALVEVMIEELIEE